MWKARELLNELGLGLPEISSTGLGEENDFLGSPTPVGLDGPVCSGLGAPRDPDCLDFYRWCPDLTANKVSGEHGAAVRNARHIRGSDLCQAGSLCAPCLHVHPRDLGQPPEGLGRVPLGRGPVTQ